MASSTPVSPIFGGGANHIGFSARERTDRVQGVTRLMQQDTTAERRIEVDRGLGTGRDGTVELHLQVFDLTDDALIEQLEGTSEHRMEHVVEAFREDEPACFGLIDHRAGLTGVHGDRLLRQDVQPTLECVRRPLEPQRGRQRHIDCVEIVAFKQRRIGIGHRTDAVRLSKHLRALRVPCCNRDDVDVKAPRGVDQRVGSDAGRTKHPEAKTWSCGVAHWDIPFQRQASPRRAARPEPS